MLGSSPRMRGALCDRGGCQEPPGIIPAYAGSTCYGVVELVLNRDHPRVCGEHEDARGHLAQGGGSSPRMRGAQHQDHRFPRREGIIPAYAGSTWDLPFGRSSTRDHPRVCGEHPTLNASALCGTGSSPRMRGAPAAELRSAGGAGIIPAYAGSTLLRPLCISL